MNSEDKPSIAVGVLITNKNGEVFLGKSPKWGGKWIVPGGHLEYGESLIDCAEREIQEELGITLDRDSIQFHQVQEEIFSPEFHNPRKHFIFINYVASFSGENVVQINDEFEDYQFVDPRTALDSLDLNSSTRAFIMSYCAQGESHA
ncbi:MAG: hypothetical protein A2912_06140 [Candidatus Buchananbacteria bacterium RIFCSPLOWO2_01_FULL_40_23b]|uniref:Nudix hydrolase domain-containing protein n=1 Tax=Candidatus Buchananbacteria bacterium RIFCSPLOWO2_01_FULL_40_23b TaxID=1797544 RepID=A0A1G1YUR1_9BACT|nr:MAG: hypothetical protein A2912_06140 [Candidatus Buchananbacteria bacterium RIFCSPLOWO2_01_FULL_40_23b]